MGFSMPGQGLQQGGLCLHFAAIAGLMPVKMDDKPFAT
jgi:hypothetical protein